MRGGSRSVRLKIHRDPIDAVAQMGWRRAVLEHMSEVTAASRAMDFRADHTVAAIDGRFDGAINRLIEARPSRPALELELGFEERLAAPHAGKPAGALFHEQG